MPAALPLLVLGGSVAAVGGVVWWTRQLERRRSDAMRLVAGTMGFEFREQADPEELGAFPLMERGRGRVGRNLLRGRLAGRQATLCDYAYVTGGGKSRAVHNQTIAVFHDPVPGLPDFELVPENIFHRIGAVFGYQDIDFDHHDDFSRAYLLRGSDEAAIRRAFNAGVLTHFAAHPGWCVQAAAGRLLAYHAGRLEEPAQLPAFGAEALRIAGVLGTPERPG